jgi:general secretion pathway protein M
MKSYWQQLNERDKIAVVVGAVVALVYLLYALLISPLFSRLEQKALHHTERQQTLSWMKDVRGQQLIKAAPKSVTNTQLLSLLATKLKIDIFRPFPFQLQQIGNGDIQLSFESVPFLMFIKWLKALNQEYNFSVKQLNAQRIETTGLAKITVVLAAS